MNKKNNRVHWSNRLAFILVAAGSAVGIGNIWKFPYITGVNGGGVFVLFYMAAMALVGLPLFIAELSIGQSAQKNVYDSFTGTAPGVIWKIPAILCIITPIMILSFYSVVGGWIFDFLYRALSGEFSRNADAKIVGGTLNSLFSNHWRQLFWHSLFSFLTGAITYAGVKKGLEKWNKVLMPALVLLLLILLVRVCFLDGFSKALKFLFSPEWGLFTGAAALEALGHAFFTLGLGVGVMITYGSYLNKDENLGRMACSVAVLDTIIALTAGVVIFSVVFSFDMEPASGPGLIFSTLPQLFVQLPGSNLIAILFFALVAFAALSSSVSVLEVLTAICEEKLRMSRQFATVSPIVFTYCLGLLCVFSTNLLSNVTFFGKTFFDLFDYLVTNWFLPVNGIFAAIYVSYKLGKPHLKKISHNNIFMYKALLITVGFISPIAIIGVIISLLI